MQAQVNWQRQLNAKASCSTPSLAVRTASSKQVVAHLTWLRRGGADKDPASPFACLHLTTDRQVSHRRYKALGKEVSEQSVEDWHRIFEDPQRPLVLDVGCGSGRCMLLLATRALQEQTQQGEAPPESFHAANFLGIDVQVGVVQAANRWAQQLGISHRLHFLAADVKGLRGQILKNYPGRVHAAAVQFPDPHFRAERHIVGPSFVEDCCLLIEHGGVVLLQSDVASTAEEMRKEFCLQGSSVFEPHPLHNEQGSNNISSLTANAWSMHHNHMSARQASARALLEAPQAQIKHSWLEAGWLADNPWNTATEREVYHANITGAPVYRLYLQRI